MVDLFLAEGCVFLAAVLVKKKIKVAKKAAAKYRVPGGSVTFGNLLRDIRFRPFPALT